MRQWALERDHQHGQNHPKNCCYPNTEVDVNVQLEGSDVVDERNNGKFRETEGDEKQDRRGILALAWH
jgi:hypothetical protein